MSDIKRVALTIFIEEEFWREAKEKMGRKKGQSFQRVGDMLLRAWRAAGMPLDDLAPAAMLKVEDPTLARCLSIISHPPVDNYVLTIRNSWHG